MKNDYVKTLLYAYAHLPKIIKRLDQIVLKKALGSMKDFSSCTKQCEKIVGLTIQKALLVELNHYLERAISRLTKEEMDMLDYRYFGTYHSQSPFNISTYSRNYYRKQQKLLKDISDNLRWLGKRDDWFEKRCLRVPFIRKLYQAVKKKDERFLIEGLSRWNYKSKMVA